ARGRCRVGEIQLALGRTEAARRSFDQYVRQCEAFAEHHTGVSRARRTLGVAYYKMGELESAQATNEALTDDLRRIRWQEARNWFRKCQDVFADMKNREMLEAGDLGVPAEIAAEIAACDVQLASLRPDER
ncbi:MAG: hypothetical protein O7B26_10790, partial [Planctomycetota bacterium]|nr:hypothetical protein [Planctomycetota bacterium]